MTKPMEHNKELESAMRAVMQIPPETVQKHADLISSTLDDLLILDIQAYQIMGEAVEDAYRPTEDELWDWLNGYALGKGIWTSLGYCGNLRYNATLGSYSEYGNTRREALLRLVISIGEK